MASAQRTPAVTETVVVTPGRTTLTLTDDEAQMLRDVLGRVSGHPDTRRGLADAVYEALNAAGFNYHTGCGSDTDGHIHFF